MLDIGSVAEVFRCVLYIFILDYKYCISASARCITCLILLMYCTDLPRLPHCTTVLLLVVLILFRLFALYCWFISYIFFVMYWSYVLLIIPYSLSLRIAYLCCSILGSAAVDLLVYCFLLGSVMQFRIGNYRAFFGILALFFMHIWLNLYWYVSYWSVLHLILHYALFYIKIYAYIVCVYYIVHHYIIVCYSSCCNQGFLFLIVLLIVLDGCTILYWELQCVILWILY